MKTFKRLISYYRYHFGRFMIGVVLQIVFVTINVYTPRVIQRLIDYITNQVKQNQVIAISVIWKHLAQMMLLIVTGAVVGYVSYLCLAYVANALTKRIRDEAYAHLQRLPISYFDDKPAGKISSRIVNDTESLREGFFQNFGNQVVVQGLLVISTYIAIFRVSIWVGLIFLGLIPILVWWQLTYARWSKPINKQWRESLSELNNQTAEIVQGVSMVQLYHQEDTINNEFKKMNLKWSDSRYKDIQLNSMFSWNFSELLGNLSITLLMAYIISGYFNQTLTFSVGTIFLLITYIRSLFWPISMLVRLMTTIQQALVSGGRVFELLDAPVEPDVEDTLLITEGKVEFRDVSFGYRPNQLVLDHISFKVKRGETLGLVGHTGSGKSSIINLLLRFYDPQSGNILIDGQDIGCFRRESVRESMGIVLQEPFLFTGTIASNVSMNHPSIDDTMIEEALERVGAMEFVKRLELGIHHPINERGQTLSSGERQLISFARTLVSNPAILILDEATSHIDTETENVIQRAMEVVKEGRTTIIVAHRLSTIQQADQIILLSKGKISEQGTHAQLLDLEGEYAKMNQIQAQISNEPSS